MTRDEYVFFRKAQKVIKEDIVFRQVPRTGPNYTFTRVPIEVQGSPTRLFLNGSYRPATRSITFNVSADGEPICRLDVRGAVHKDQCRTHKHETLGPECARNNLPHALARPDLEDKGPVEVFQELCKAANIDLQGKFMDPAEERTP